MRKLKLDPDALRVESFDAEAAEAEKLGTVRGHNSVYSNCAKWCESRSEVDCDCVIETRVEQFTCYAGCM